MVKRLDKTRLLIDGDILAYRASAANEELIEWGDGVTSHTLDEGAARAQVREVIAALSESYGDPKPIVALSDSAANGWRRKVLPTYKANRPARKPTLLGPLKDWIRQEYNTYERATLEADDILGILATHPTLAGAKERIVVSIDKDLATVPGLLLNPNTAPLIGSEPAVISEFAADLAFFTQVLTGDSTDNYTGCPGVGPVGAEKILTGATTAQEMWAAVLDAYLQRGHSEEFALTQARVARICRVGDYDFKRKEVKLWSPLNQ